MIQSRVGKSALILALLNAKLNERLSRKTEESMNDCETWLWRSAGKKEAPPAAITDISDCAALGS